MAQSVSGFAEVNGAKIHYDVSGEGQPLLLVHAGIGDSRMWDDQVPVFAEQYRVVRFDARGYGQTELVPGKYSYHDDIYGMMRFLAIERAFVLGCSMGGAAAVDFTLAHPEMVAALIPVCSGVSGLKRRGMSDAQAEKMEEAYLRGDFETCGEIMCQVWVDGPSRTPEQANPAVRRKVYEMVQIVLRAPDEVGEEVEAEPPALDRLGSIHAPTLVIYGDLDQPSILEASEVLATGIPGARKVLIPGTAHAPNMEKPAEFNRAVLEFLSGL